MSQATLAPTESSALTKRIGLGVLLLFFLSGATGLVYETIWTRLLRLVMGNTVYSMTTVLCAFMGGLALGSYLGGRWVVRRNDPIRLYGLLEGAVGLYVFVLPLLIRAVEPIFAAMYRDDETSHVTLTLIRFAICGGLLLLPSTMMGATVPVMTRFFVTSTERVGWPVGRLYAVNTFGAVAGCFAAGFILLPYLHLWPSFYGVGVVNLLIAAAALYLHRRVGRMSDVAADGGSLVEVELAAAAATGDTDRAGALRRRIVMVCYGFSGLAALVYEIAWVRVLSLLIGSSTYAFSLMLTAFILGLALGSMAFSRWADRTKRPIRDLAVIELAIGVTALMVVPLFSLMPWLVMRLIASNMQSFWALQGAEFVLIFLIMTVPTFLMGAAFPLAVRIVVSDVAQASGAVGRLYAMNTLGSIAGAFAGGFLLIPALGIQKTIIAAVAVNFTIGCGLLWLERTFALSRRAIMTGVCAGMIVIAFGLLPQWNAARMTIGPYMLAIRSGEAAAGSRAAMARIVARRRVLFHQEGVSTTVTVTEMPGGERSLLLNGKADASTGAGDMPTQLLIAHAPMMMHDDPRDVLVIGLASGITLGAAGVHPAKTLDCVEISPGVVRACRFFDEQNNYILDDRRVRMIIGDGRNHVALTKRTYDVITSEPSNPWIAGIGDLFTREFFRLCEKRLNDGGVVCIWLSAYNMDLEVFRSVVFTFQSVFPHVSIWQPTLNDYLLVGTKHRSALDWQAMQARIEGTQVGEQLRQVGINDAGDLLARILLTSEAVRSFAAGAALHTDDNSLLEFRSPRTMYRQGGFAAIAQSLGEYQADLSPFLAHSGNDAATIESAIKQVADIKQARRLVASGRELAIAGEMDEAEKRLTTAVELDPDDLDARMSLARVLVASRKPAEAIAQYEATLQLDPGNPKAHRALGETLYAQNEHAKAIRYFEKALALDPDDAMLLGKLGLAYAIMGHDREAIELLRKAVELAPLAAGPRTNLATQLDKLGLTDEAMQHYRAAIDIDPDALLARENLAALLIRLERYGEAARHLKHALGLAPQQADLHRSMAAVRQQLEQYDDALQHLETAAQLDPDDAQTHNNLGAMYGRLGQTERAIEHFSEAVRLKPEFELAKRNLERARKALEKQSVKPPGAYDAATRP